MGTLLPSRSLAVARMHHDVHENQVDLVGLRRLQRLPAVVGLDGLVALAGEIDIQRRHNVSVVVTDQDGVHVNGSSPVYF